MAQFLQKILGGGSTPAPVADDAGFADFAASPAAPSPVPAPAATGLFAGNIFTATTGSLADRPYTKWYRVWERTQPRDFIVEGIILPLLILVIVVHLWGKSANKKRARAWIQAHASALRSEFAVVGFGGYKKTPTADDIQSMGALQAEGSDALVVPEEMLRENTASEYITYATGRQNVAFLDVKITLAKRYNPLIMFGESLLGFFFEALPATVERVEASAYAFDGREKDVVPASRGELIKPGPSSTYDGFVFAIVNKDMMKQLRSERYDISLTSTKDHPKLPAWATIMSESSEITEAMLTPELIKAVEQAGDSLEAFVISDQPLDKPEKLQDTDPRKRITLSYRLPSGTNPSAYDPTLPIFKIFLRTADTLVTQAHFRPEIMKRVRATRDEEIRRLRKKDEEAKAEERKLEADKAKKEKREAELRGLTADQQKKYLDKEREKAARKGQKRMTMR